MRIEDVEVALGELRIKIARQDRGKNGPEARCACPFCVDSKDGESFAINLENGKWRCHRCNERGNLFTLRRRLRGPSQIGPIIAKKAEPDGRVIPESFLAQLEVNLYGDTPEAKVARGFVYDERRLAADVARRARLGFDPAHGPNGAIAIPYFLRGICVGVKYRRLPPGDRERRYDREPGCVHPLYGIDVLDDEFDRVVIVEGELDRLALLSYGVKCPILSLPDGGSATLRESDREALLSADEILIATDQDKAGDESAERHAQALGRFRCRRVRLPRKDAGDCLKDGVPAEEVLAKLEGAAVCAESLVKPVGAWRQALLSPPSNARGRGTGHASLDALIGGWRPGEVTILTADTGSGKSTLANDFARRQAEAGHPAMVASLELGGRAVARKLLSSVAGKLWDQLTGDDLVAAVDTLEGMPIYILDRYGDVRADLLRDEIAYAVRRYGVEFVVVDHLHFALGVRKPGEDERLLLDAAAHSIQVAAIDLGVHILLVAHPAKIRAETDGKKRTPGLGDLKGSSGPEQFADNVAAIERVGECGARLYFYKVRSELGKPGKINLAFDPQTLRFAEV